MKLDLRKVKEALSAFGEITQRDRDFFIENEVFPIDFNRDTMELTVGTTQSITSTKMLSVKQDLQRRTRAVVNFVKIEPSLIATLMTKFLGQQAPMDEVEEEFASVDVKSSEVGRTLTGIIADAVDKEATDIHIEPMRNSVRVRIRVAGTLRTLYTLKKEVGFGVIRRFMLDAGMKIDEMYAPQGGRIRRQAGGRIYNMRLETNGTINGPELVIRLLPESNNFMSLEELGFHDSQIKELRRMMKKKGIILTTGPTGAGKTTTQYAMLSEINTEDVKIVTIEDPPEITMEGVIQTAVKEERGAGWEPLLEAVLRRDPDVILIGEIRDPLSAKVALEAAMTGHLVFATMHVDRIENIPERFLQFSTLENPISRFDVANSLIGMVAQRILKKVYTPTALRVPPLDWVKEAFREKGVELQDKRYYMANKKATNEEEGYRKGYIERGSSRTIAAEVVYVNDTLKEVIYGGSTRKIREYLNGIEGHISLARHAAIKAEQGIVDLMDAASVL